MAPPLQASDIPSNPDFESHPERMAEFRIYDLHPGAATGGDQEASLKDAFSNPKAPKAVEATPSGEASKAGVRLPPAPVLISDYYHIWTYVL